MPKSPNNADPMEWHRFFAIECNNRAWDLVEKVRTKDEDHEMLTVAHASAFHWSVAGEKCQHLRAKMLLAEVHALLGFGVSALSLAEEVRTDLLSQDTPDWEVAYIYTVHAHATWVAGHRDVYRVAYERARAAIEAVVDDASRRMVKIIFNQIPFPG